MMKQDSAWFLISTQFHLRNKKDTNTYSCGGDQKLVLIQVKFRGMLRNSVSRLRRQEELQVCGKLNGMAGLPSSSLLAA